MKKANIFLAITLILLGIACGIVSTYATINPIQKAFTGDVRYIMIVLFVIVQISVFFLAMMKHYIEREAPQHYLLVSRISNLLMIVSIVSTITFFNMNKHIVKAHSDSIKEIFNIIPYVNKLGFYNWMVNITTNIIFTWSVCVLLDVMAIKLPPVGFDLLAGIKNKRRQYSLIGMLAAIIIYKPKTMIENKYKELYELKRLESAEVKEVKSEEPPVLIQKQEVNTEIKQEDDKPKRTNSNVVNLERGLKGLEHKVKIHILDKYKNGDTISVKELRDKFNLTVRQWSGIRDNLSILTTRGTKTIVISSQQTSYPKG
jgi:hypothetical protein